MSTVNTSSNVPNNVYPKNISSGCGLLGCLAIPGLLLLPLLGIASGIFPWLGIVLLCILVVGLLLTYRNWRKDPKLVVNLLVAGMLLFTTVGCSAVTNIKFGGWWTDPVIPTTRGIISRQEWFTKDYLEGYKDWKDEDPGILGPNGYQYLLWFEFLIYTPIIGGGSSLIEVGSAWLLPHKLLHVSIDERAPKVPAHITSQDDPFSIWMGQIKYMYYFVIEKHFIRSKIPCPIGNCAKEWSYFWGVEDIYHNFNK